MGDFVDERNWTKKFCWKKIIKNNKTLEEEKKNEVYKKFKSLFPDAELVNVDKKE